jgi:hypothetical protein
MDGCGAVASPYLYNSSEAATSTSKSNMNQHFGCYITLLYEQQQVAFDSQKSQSTCYEFDWDLMKKIENCNDRAFLKVPSYVKYMEEETDEATTDSAQCEQVKSEFIFDEAKFYDAVVIPFYRNNDMLPQLYCVSAVDSKLTPLSPFPVSNIKVNLFHYTIIIILFIFIYFYY